MRQSYLIIYNSLTNYGRAVIQGLISFLLVPFIISRIGSEQYGIVILATTAYGMIELFGMGLSKAVIKYHAQARAKNHIKLVNLIFNSSLILFFVIGIMGSFVIFSLSYFFDNIFHKVPSYLVSEGKLALFIIGFTIIPCIVLDVFKGILSGEQRYDIVNLISISSVILRALFIVTYFFLIQPSLLAVVIIYSLSYILERIGYFFASHKFIKGLKISIGSISKLGIKIIIGFSGMVLIATMANMLAAHLFKFIIGAKLTLKDLTYYGVLLLLSTTANLLVRSFVNVLVPVASKYYELGDHHRIRKLLVHGTKYSMIIIFSLTFITIPFLKDLLKVWMGKEFVHIWTIGVIMFLGQIISSAAITANQILSGLGKVKILAFSSSISVIIGLGLSVIYLFYYPSPILLVAVSLITIQRFVNTTIVNIYSLKYIKIKLINLIYEAYFFPFLISIGLLGFGFAISLTVKINNWSTLIGTVFLIEALYFVLIYLFSLTLEEKFFVKSFIMKSVSKVNTLTHSKF